MTPRQKIEAALDAMAPEIRAAFLACIEDIKSAAQLNLIAGHLANGDVESAIAALNLRPEFLAPLDRVLAEQFYRGGVAAMAAMPRVNDPFSGARLELRFDGRNERAERYLREHSSTLVTEIIADQREAVREVARAGMEAGNNPRTTALEIVGRVNKVTGKREGGILGLTSQQAGFVRNARAQLLSGDPAEMRAYLERGRRDKRFDRTVMKAIREGKPVSAADVEKITQRYSASLLRMRGEVIGRTEALTSLGAAQYESALQLIESGAVQASQVKFRWASAADGRVRDSHASLNGQEVQVGQPFISPLTGARMRYPGDTELGAPASDTIQCRCNVSQVIDYLAPFGRVA